MDSVSDHSSLYLTSLAFLDPHLPLDRYRVKGCEFPSYGLWMGVIGFMVGSKAQHWGPSR